MWYRTPRQASIRHNEEVVNVMADDKIGILQATEKYARVTNNAPARIDIDVFRQENTPTMIEIFLNGNAHGTGLGAFCRPSSRWKW